MRTCSYCGKEYADDIERCLIDNTSLAGEPPVLATEDVPLSVAPSPTFEFPGFTERQMLIFEIVLVCVIAFGSGIITSTYIFFESGSTASSTSRSTVGWLIQALRQGSALALVWYLLLRRGKNFSNLGLVWSLKDFGWSILIYFAKSFAFRAVFYAIFFSGLTALNYRTTTTHINSAVFSGGITLAALLVQVLNPFFEELIVRAYLMTEVKALTNSAAKAIIVSTVLQTSYHFYQGAPAAFGHGAAFLIYSIYYSKTNRIAPVILAHLYTDVGGALWYFYQH